MKGDGSAYRFRVLGIYTADLSEKKLVLTKDMDNKIEPKQFIKFVLGVKNYKHKFIRYKRSMLSPCFGEGVTPFG